MDHLKSEESKEDTQRHKEQGSFMSLLLLFKIKKLLKLRMSNYE
jgi:hypothetical protein